MSAHRKNVPPSFMIRPATCWSVVTLIPQSRSGMS